MIFRSLTLGCVRELRFPIAPQVSGVTRTVLELIVAHNVSPSLLARRSGVCREVIYRWAKGHAPRVHDLEAVAQVLGGSLILHFHHTTEKERPHHARRDPEPPLQRRHRPARA